jgi:putative peptidoglycan lipid II flippase
MALSLLAGLALDAVIALFFGAGSASDSFFVAARLPLGINLLVLGGATQALTPAFSRLEGDDQSSVASRVLVATFLGSLAVWALGALLAGPLTLATAPGLEDSAMRAAVEATRVMFGVVPLVLAAEVLRAVLNANGRFGTAGAMNVVMSGTSIALIAFGPHLSATSLAVAFVLGAAAQLGFVFVKAAATGFRLRPTGWGDGRAAAVGRMAVRPTAAAGVNLGNRIAEQVLLSFLPPGSVTIANYGNRLISAVAGLTNRSTSVAALPRMTRAAAAGDDEGVARTARDALRIMASAAFVLTAFTAVLARPAVKVAFERGEFNAADAHLLGAMLAIYSLSLVGSAVQRAMLTLWLARLNTRMQLSSAVVGVVVDVVLLVPCLALFGWGSRQSVLGVALAWSLAQYAVAWYCYARTRKAFHITFRAPVRFIATVAALTALAAATMVVATMTIPVPDTRLGALLGGGIVAAAGTLILVLGGLLLRRGDRWVGAQPR